MGDADDGGRPADPDSRARTHLANERTLLAWLRTALSLIALGLAAAQFLPRDLVPGFPVTAVFAAMLVGGGVVMAIAAGIHYGRSRDQIDAGAFRAGGRVIVVAVGLIAFAGVVALGLVVLLRS